MISTVVGGYKLQRELGQGGFGTAYLAEKNDQLFVVKFLRADATTITLERFHREIRSLQKVQHRLVVGYVDHGEAPGPMGPRKYLVMPYLQGITLFQARQTEPVWPSSRVLRLARDVLEALTAVHAMDIVHRDIKPTNIWLKADGEAMLLDFGIAKLLDYSSITQGFAPLTWRYASPEQALDTVDGRSDLYSLGAVMYELLTGRPTFDASDPFTFLKRLREDMPDLPSYHNPDISAPVENLVMELLAKQPYQRPTSAVDVIDLIDQIRDDSTSTPQPLRDTGVGPRYFVHLQQNEAEPLRLFLRQGGQVMGIVYGASQLLSSATPLSVAGTSNVPVFIDPETHRLARSDFSRTAGLRNLPWVKDPLNPLRPADFETVQAFQDLACGVVALLREKGSAAIFAPYFHFNDMASPWLKYNQKLIAETRAGLKADEPLYAVISTDIETVCDDNARRGLLNLYTRVDVDGYWFLVNFDEVTASPAQLFNYCRLLLEFRQTRRSVVASRVGSFGLGLLAAGITAFTSGMTTLENFSWSYFTDRSKMAGGQQRCYLEALLQNVSDETAAALLNGELASEFGCSCAGCKGSVVDRTKWLASRIHVLTARQRQIETLMRLPAEERMAWFQAKVRKAQELALRAERLGYRIRREHYDRWLDVTAELVQRGLVRAA